MKKCANIPLIWHSYLFAAITGILTAAWPIPGIVTIVAILLCDRRLHAPARLFLTIAIFIAAYAPSIIYKQHIEEEIKNPPGWTSHVSRICGKIENVQGLPGNRLRISLSAVRPFNDPSAPALPGTVRWNLLDPPANFQPLPGQQACISRQIQKQRAFQNSSYNQDTVRFANGQFWRIFSKGSSGNPELLGKGNFFTEPRARLKSLFLQALHISRDKEKTNPRPSQANAILLALLFGDRSFLDQQTVQDFSASSLAHSLALSGQHLCVTALAAFLLVHLAGRFFPRLYLQQTRLFWISVLSLPLAIFYLWLGNAPPSLIRAFSMLFVLALFITRKQAWSGIDLVCMAILLALIFNPFILYDIGMQLSVACVLAIVLIAPHIPHLPTLPPRYARFKPLWTSFERIWQIFCVSLIIQIFILPLVLLHFYQTSLWFPLNILWLPVLGIFVLPCAFLALLFSLFSTNLAAIFIKMAAVPCEWLLDILEKLKQINLLEMPALLLPHWTALLAFIALAGAICVFFNGCKERKTAIFTLLALAFLAVGPTLRLIYYLDKTLQISALDVGQGQALLIKFEGSGHLLIDGGGSNSKDFDIGKMALVPALTNNLPPKLSAVINSHPDMDHVGGILTISQNFKLGSIFHNGNDLNNSLKNKWRMIRNNHSAPILLAGDVIYLGNKKTGLKLDVLYPAASKIPDSMGGAIPPPHLTGNEASIVLRLSRNEKGITIMPGDATETVLNKLAMANINLEARMVFAPHHGSDKSLAPAFYSKLRPDMVIASCGYQNRWNFPGKKLKAFLAEKEIPLFTTSASGKICATIDKDERINLSGINQEEILDRQF